jgi:hypothetical protein
LHEKGVAEDTHSYWALLEEKAPSTFTSDPANIHVEILRSFVTGNGILILEILKWLMFEGMLSHITIRGFPELVQDLRAGVDIGIITEDSLTIT